MVWEVFAHNSASAALLLTSAGAYRNSSADISLRRLFHMAEDLQVLAKFVTKLPKELQVSGNAVAVPVTLKRYGLSQVVNHLLALGMSWDFL
jgi:hypothetical protein